MITLELTQSEAQNENEFVLGTKNHNVVVKGGLSLANLPTSEPNVARQIWNDNGTLKVS